MGDSETPCLDALRGIVSEAAREEILGRFHQCVLEYKSDGSVVTEADRAMQQRLAAELTRRWPQTTLLGEEMPAAQQARALAESTGGVWCLDPLDGTSNFAAGVPLFTVSLALIKQGRVTAGLVYDPLRDECFTAQAGGGAWLNGASLRPQAAPPLRRCLAGVDLKRLSPGLARRLAAEPPYGSQRNFGSCALEWAWVACNRIHLYVHGGQALWDLAAGQLILAEAGGSSTTLESTPVFDGTLGKRSVVAALDPQTLRSFRAWLGDTQ